MSDDSENESGSEMDSSEEFPEGMPSREDEDGSVEDSEEGDDEVSGMEVEGMTERDEGDLSDPKTVRERIDTNLAILGDFKARPVKSMSRSEVIAELVRDLSEYYGYIEELAGFLMELFSPS